MRKTFNKLMRNEKGQALPVVLILLVIGGLTVTPLLTYMSTGLNTGRIQEGRVAELYAADAGVEDALWRIENDEVSFNPYDYDTELTYPLPKAINDRDVIATIKQVWPLNGLEDDKNGTMPHKELVIVGYVIDEEEGEYQAEVTYDGSKGNLKIDRIGVWLPSNFEYITDSSSGVTIDNPAESAWRGGKALTWDFHPAVNFEDLPLPPAPPPPPGGFTPADEFPMKRILTFNFSPVGEMKGCLSWIRTNRHDIYLSWDIGCGIYKITATATSAATGKNTTVESYASKEIIDKEQPLVQGDYRAIGNTLMEDANHDSKGIRDHKLSESRATISDIPSDAEVAWAYLYWSAWWETNDADRNISFKVNDRQVYFDQQGDAVEGDKDITASKWWILPNKPGTYSYSCFKNVTSLVKLISLTGNGEYTVGGVSGALNDEWSYAGWCLIIIYSSPSEKAHQLYLYDDFLYADNDTSHIFAITGFKAPDDAQATLTCFVAEGDECYGDHQYDYYSDAPWGDTDWIKFNDNYQFDAVNPIYNVWNGKSSGLSGEFIDGVDIDTFDVSSPIINEGDTSAEVKLGTGVDSWNLVCIILSFRSDASTGLKPNTVGTITYEYEVGS